MTQSIVARVLGLKIGGLQREGPFGSRMQQFRVGGKSLKQAQFSAEQEHGHGNFAGSGGEQLNHFLPDLQLCCGIGVQTIDQKNGGRGGQAPGGHQIGVHAGGKLERRSFRVRSLCQRTIQQPEGCDLLLGLVRTCLLGNLKIVGSEVAHGISMAVSRDNVHRDQARGHL